MFRFNFNNDIMECEKLPGSSEISVENGKLTEFVSKEAKEIETNREKFQNIFENLQNNPGTFNAFISK